MTVKLNEKDISKVYNKSLSSAVSTLGFKHVTKMDKRHKIYTGYNKSVNSTTMYYTATGSYSSSKTYIVGESYYKNSPGKFTAQVRDKSLSVFGAKVGMSPGSSHEILKKSGWNLLFDGIAYNGALAKTSRMYSKSNGSIINLTFKSGKVYDITYQWRMESEF